jgi:hypothetical protein
MAVMKGGAKQSIRNHVVALVFGFAPIAHTMANLLSEVAVAYSDSPLRPQSAHVHRGPQTGRRAPIREGEPVVGSGNIPLFALFAEDTPASRSLLSKYPNLVEPSPRKPYADGGIWVVRPDGHVALVAKDNAWNDVDAYLRSPRERSDCVRGHRRCKRWCGRSRSALTRIIFPKIDSQDLAFRTVPENEVDALYSVG